MSIQHEIWQTARDAGRALADTLHVTLPCSSDHSANRFLEKGGQRFCEVLLKQGLPHELIERALDQLAEAFEARLAELENPIQPPTNQRRLQ